MSEVRKVPGKVRLTAYYKGDWSQDVEMVEGGSPYDLTGATAVFSIYDRNGTQALSLSSGSGITHTGAGGVLTITATNAQVVDLNTHDYNYELILTLQSGRVWPILDGIFSVTEDGDEAATGDNVSVVIENDAITLTLPSGSIGPQGEADKRIGGVLLSDPSAGTLTGGDTKAFIRIPADLDGMVLVDVGAACSTSASSGTTTIQYRRVRAGVSVDMLSTTVTIDANQQDSSTAAVAAVINSANREVLEGDQIHFDLDTVGTGCLGLFVSFTFDNA